MTSQTARPVRIGSLDGIGAGDHDEPYRFGRHPHALATFPFNLRQFARLLVLRGRVQDGDFADDGAPAPRSLRSPLPHVVSKNAPHSSVLDRPSRCGSLATRTLSNYQQRADTSAVTFPWHASWERPCSYHTTLQ
jgi:hypothetical protein